MGPSNEETASENRTFDSTSYAAGVCLTPFDNRRLRPSEGLLAALRLSNDGSTDVAELLAEPGRLDGFDNGDLSPGVRPGPKEDRGGRSWLDNAVGSGPTDVDGPETKMLVEAASEANGVTLCSDVSPTRFAV